MKPHQGLAQAATCQLWPQNFSASATVSASFFSPLLPSGSGAVCYFTTESDMYPQSHKSQECSLAASPFSLLISPVFWRGVCPGISGLREVSFQASGRSFLGCPLGPKSVPLLDSSGFIGCPVSARKQCTVIWDSEGSWHSWRK